MGDVPAEHAETVDAASADLTAAGSSATLASAPRIRGRRRASILPIGTSVGRYELGERLGAGGMGVVYRARDPRLARDVAVKLVASEGRLDAQARLEREAQAMAKLSHPNVCAVYDIGAWNDQLFIAMELCPRGTLSGWLDAARDWRAIVAAFIAAGRGLAAAHQLGIVHRDFKPDNVLIGHDGLVKVTDFGLARTARERGAIEGTPAYMAPEQLAGGDVDARGDQFAFAVSLWQALCGTLPYQPDPAAATVFDGMLAAIRSRRRLRGESVRAPQRILAILGRALDPEPDARWPSLDAMLAALARASVSRRRLVAIAAALVVVPAIAVAIAMQTRAPTKVYGPERDVDPIWMALGDSQPDVDARVAFYMDGYRQAANPTFMLAAARAYLMAQDCRAVRALSNYHDMVPIADHEDVSHEVNMLDIDIGRLSMTCIHVTDQVDDPDQLVEIAQQAERMGDYPRAIDALKKAARSMPDRSDLWKELADAQMDGDDCPGERISLDRWLAAIPQEHRAEWEPEAKRMIESCNPVEDGSDSGSGSATTGSGARRP